MPAARAQVQLGAERASDRAARGAARAACGGADHAGPIAARTGAHICAGNGLTPATSAPGQGSRCATSAPGRGSPLPHRLGTGLALCNICTATGAMPAISAAEPGWPLPHRRPGLLPVPSPLPISRPCLVNGTRSLARPVSWLYSCVRLERRIGVASRRRRGPRGAGGLARLPHGSQVLQVCNSLAFHRRKLSLRRCVRARAPEMRTPGRVCYASPARLCVGVGVSVCVCVCVCACLSRVRPCAASARVRARTRRWG